MGIQSSPCGDDDIFYPSLHSNHCRLLRVCEFLSPVAPCPGMAQRSHYLPALQEEQKGEGNFHSIPCYLHLVPMVSLASSRLLVSRAMACGRWVDSCWGLV